ncbi:MAG TPA: hypothetical protein VFO10_10715 [Oligoflexus sp.]|uniref:hypothetical protein n=1 Tax=Oligoflexus sp. TaxID=1971216 RepID=UPI002D80C340|nr:hypothetical protein [Oligoflexus sp.]HET9237716.1 hypothetical protein [Oligoflexus sp.]
MLGKFFEEPLFELPGTHQNVSILIGNGFNRALPQYGRKFDWDNLVSCCQSRLDALDEALLKISENQFEKALEKLSVSIEIAQNAPQTEKLIALLNIPLPISSKLNWISKRAPVMSSASAQRHVKKPILKPMKPDICMRA